MQPVETDPHRETEQLMSITDLANFLRVGRRTLQTWLARGQMPAADLSIGQTRRWRRDTIERWIDQSYCST